MANKTRFISFTALFAALTAIVTLVLPVPVPKSGGYINIGDAVIFVCAYILGGIPAMVAGGIGSAIADLILGYAIFSPFTLVVKGLEGLIAGLLIALVKRHFKGKAVYIGTVFAIIIAGLEMVVGYFLTSWLLYGISAAAVEIVMNFIQLGISVAAAVAVIIAMNAARLIKSKNIGEKPPEEGSTDGDE